MRGPKKYPSSSIGIDSFVCALYGLASTCRPGGLGNLFNLFPEKAF